MDQSSKYQQWQKEREQHWESLCGRCGACCGAFDDPCEHLDKNEQGYFCRIYSNRFGQHKTISGKVMHCVSIRKILHESWQGDSCCGYKKYLKK